ncbi:hypothetical protein EJ04DRAFT_234693 [Polyplosphaeria fusca]|uniref:Uncharacterized protein n=1 Tax=Polyplosphaeria fusca TaxID=682080 RepID=A0A9P4V6U6_9PLEO|nr:hypothetical protein EJ04DRAFT_234693 [Polyplosphaeria fusca]
MNWTGGSLQRHSRATNGGVVRRQKQHFAKVRTQLQNGSHESSISFRPSFSQGDNFSIGSHMPVFGLGSRRHTGHSKRIQDERAHDVLPRLKSPHPARASVERTRSKHSRCRMKPKQQRSELVPFSPDAVHAQSKRGPYEDTSAMGPEAESQSLEAHKKRLLERQDWAGLAVSRPLSMHFASKREKDGIGKRRKTEGRHAIRRGGNGEERRCRSRTHHEPGLFDARGRRNDVESVKIRIGTAALMSQTPRLNSDYVDTNGDQTREHESSDLMLFDHANENAAVGILGYGHEVAGCTDFGRTEGCDAEDGRDHVSSLSADEYQETIPLDNEVQPGKARAAHSPIHMQGIGSDFRLLQQVGGGAAESLRFVFDHRFDIPTEVSAQEEAADNAEMAKLGNRRARAHGPLTNGVLDGRAPIVDQSPWQAFLAIPEASSSRSRSEKSTLQHSCHTDQDEASDRHATVGDNTRNSSNDSISLPSLQHSRREAKWNENGVLGVGAAGLRSKRGCAQAVDENEQLWKSFVVLGKGMTDSEACSATQTGKASRLESLKEDGLDCCPRPLLAVSSPNPQAFTPHPESASRSTSRVSESV